MTSADKFFERWIKTVEENYIKVYGIEKWYSLTPQQKHDAIMFLTKDIVNGLKAYEQRL